MRLPEPVRLGPVTRTDLVRYAGASGDFNPLHHDPDFARAAGLPDVMAHGMYAAGLVARELERWFGPGRLARYGVRFRAPVWPGDVLLLSCDGIRPAPDGTELTLTLARPDGEVALTGRATLRPSAPEAAP